MTDLVELFTDGACRGNPGPGGWGVLLRYKGVEKELFGGEIETTNNRMELTAVIKALHILNRECKVRVTTDSQYVKNGITMWIRNWRRNGWKTAKKQPVKNVDLWRALDDVVKDHDIEWAWVKGHSGHRENDLADELANRGTDEVIANGGNQSNG